MQPEMVSRKVLSLFVCLGSSPRGLWDLCCPAGIEPMPPTVQAGRVNHRAARQVSQGRLELGSILKDTDSEKETEGALHGRTWGARKVEACVFLKIGVYIVTELE